MELILMDQKEIWIDQLQKATYEIGNCLCELEDNNNFRLREVMEQIEVTGRHLLNLALEMKQEMKKQ